MTFFSESDDYRERSLNIQMSQVNKDKQYLLLSSCLPIAYFMWAVEISCSVESGMNEDLKPH